MGHTFDDATAASGASVLTLAQIKAHLRVEGTDEDTYLTALAGGVEDWAARYLGVAWSSAARTEDLDGGGVGLWPSYCPVSAVTSVTDNETAIAESTDNYAVWNDQVLRDDRSRWGDGRARYRVVYTGGYSAVPDGIVVALLQLVSRAYDNRGGKAGEAAAGWSGNWQELLGGDIAVMLSPYKHGRRV